jgi:hypothetical protein
MGPMGVFFLFFFFVYCKFFQKVASELLLDGCLVKTT